MAFRIAIAVGIMMIALHASVRSQDLDFGQAEFLSKCAACHGATGAGDTTMGKNLKLKDLGSADVQKQSDADLTTTISAGKGKMPAYKGKLTDAQISDLVKYIRTLKK